MFKIDVTYPDFAGNERTDTLRFNLTETELNNMAMDSPIFDINFLKYMVEDGNVAAMFKIIQTMLLESYGEVSEDGRTFRKSEQIKNDFKCSLAFDALVNKMLNTSDTSLVTDFMMGVFPSKFAEAFKQQLDSKSLEVIG